MTFDKKRAHVMGRRKEAKEQGCKTCEKHTFWLILKGGPSLYDMLRVGASVKDLDTAMDTRGWYCRSCVTKNETAAVTVMIDEARIKAKMLKRRDDCQRFLMTIKGDSDYEKYGPKRIGWSSLPGRMAALLKNSPGKTPEDAYFELGAFEENRNAQPTSTKGG